MNTRVTTGLLIIVLASGPLQVGAESRILSFKTSVHQCFYQNNEGDLVCPDGAFISDISSAHTLITATNGTTGYSPQFADRKIALATIEEYAAGALYAGGDLATHIGHVYQCKPYPASNLCGQAPASYEPGTGWDWEKVWVEVK